MTPAHDACGPLDIADRRGLIPTSPVPRDEVAALLAQAIRSSHFDGAADAADLAADKPAAIALGRRTLAKVQRREHERFGTALWFERLRRDLRLPAPRLLDADEAETRSGRRWWLVMARVPGEEAGDPTPSRMRALGAAMRAWHEQAEHHGLRLDDPGGLGVLLGSYRKRHPASYEEASARLAEVCAGQRMTAVHGDAAVGHNTLFTGDKLAALLDPGAVHVAPPMLDLAWSLAVDLPRGGEAEPLLEGYGRDGVDSDALDALQPHLYLRRLVDARGAGWRVEEAWLADRLARSAPELLALLDQDA